MLLALSPVAPPDSRTGAANGSACTKGCSCGDCGENPGCATILAEPGWLTIFAEPSCGAESMVKFAEPACGGVCSKEALKAEEARSLGEADEAELRLEPTDGSGSERSSDCDKHAGCCGTCGWLCGAARCATDIACNCPALAEGAPSLGDAEAELRLEPGNSWTSARSVACAGKGAGCWGWLREAGWCGPTWCASCWACRSLPGPKLSRVCGVVTCESGRALFCSTPRPCNAPREADLTPKVSANAGGSGAKCSGWDDCAWREAGLVEGRSGEAEEVELRREPGLSGSACSGAAGAGN